MNNRESKDDKGSGSQKYTESNVNVSKSIT